MSNEKRDTQVSTDVLDRKWIDVNIPCQAACPIMTDIPGYIQAIMIGDYQTAYYINRLDNVLPGVLGRVCSRPCEPACRHGRDGLGDPVAICFLKRSAADFGKAPLKPEIQPKNKRVCIIGAGPAGLTAANDLALKGYETTILEQANEAGGMLQYGIPQFRLPYDVVAADVKSITDLGVIIKTRARIDSSAAIEKLKKEYDAVLLAGGCQIPKTVDIPGIDSLGVYWGVDFMIAANMEDQETTVNSMDEVVVVGGGFTAVDCARMAYRLGAKHITLAYRRTRDDMYIGNHEIEALQAEGIRLMSLVSPVGVENQEGRVTGVSFSHNRIAKSGGAVEAIAGSEFVLDADTVVFAVGQKAEEHIAGDIKKADADNFFEAGDFRNGASTVIEAAADGRKAAREIHRFLSGADGYRDIVNIEEVKTTGRERDYDFIPRQLMAETPLHERRLKNKEVELGFSKERSLIEARRCYLCFYNFQIDIDRCIYCLACIDAMPVDCIKMTKDIRVDDDGDLHYIETRRWDEVEAIAIDNDKCIRCGNCVRACPVDCISISKFSLEMKEAK